MVIRIVKIIVATSGFFYSGLFPQTFIPQSVTDQTPTDPLSNPGPSSFEPRYISGLGSDNSFTLFCEDRAYVSGSGYALSRAATTSGPTGFPSSVTAGDIYATHFIVKDWPINVYGTDYAYRAWASTNSPDHYFYVSNDLNTWTQVSTFQVSNASGFTPPRSGVVYYGFHDVIQINGTYYAFAEAQSSAFYLVRSVLGGDVWEAFALMGGNTDGDGPLLTAHSGGNGWVCTGNFIDLGYKRGIGSLFVDPSSESYTNYYLAINTAAKTGLPAADLEAAFINPSNWTWNDGSTGRAANPILTKTASHDLREGWIVPNSDPDADWTIIYSGNYGSSKGSYALGYATLTPPESSVRIKLKTWLEGAYVSGGSMHTSLQSAGPIPSVSPYSDGRDGGSVPASATDWVQVELRETPSGSPAAVRSFFLKSDGTLIEPDGSEDLTVPGAGAGGYYVVLNHRNHGAVMSADTVGLDDSHAAEYDFRNGAGRYYGSNGAKEMETGVYGMWAGDLNQDKNMTTTDYTSWYNSARLGESGYRATDINLDGVVTTSDYTMWYNNARLGAASQVP